MLAHDLFGDRFPFRLAATSIRIQPHISILIALVNEIGRLC